MFGEVLSGLIRNDERSGCIQGVKMDRTPPAISHLLFVDHTIIFCKATNEACHSIDRILKKYALASGQLINHDKSTITFSHNASQERKEKLTNILGMRLEDHRDKYLGLPSIANERKRGICSY
ncbi:UNVERIFIED_CONTAM: hypothetical protein Sradi_3628200 [Sesamum radiatum]|uniref:Reverse transcriptase domain-containing protein n=1 Tax=Sesamum radiatum TaxID=300843 RepID=A0AAW2QIB3_SESRA